MSTIVSIKTLVRRRANKPWRYIKILKKVTKCHGVSTSDDNI